MKEADKILGVSIRLLQIWDKEGRHVRAVGGRRKKIQSKTWSAKLLAKYSRSKRYTSQGFKDYGLNNR